MPLSPLCESAVSVWQAAVDAVRPHDLLREAFADAASPLAAAVRSAPRILVVGGGKAGGAMAEALEEALGDRLPRAEGVVNVPADAARPLRRIRLHAARPAGSNHPTAAGVAGSEEMLRLLGQAGPEDVAFCLLSGGGSALLPAPVEGVSLEDKQAVTKLLHACGATINEMNAVRKHLSRIKGGRLAQAFRGRALFSLIISDVVGDPLDVIASGPTAADPTSFGDALGVLRRYELLGKVPASVRDYLEAGARGEHPETLKELPPSVHNRILGNNARALCAAAGRARELGFPVLNLGSFIQGETREVARVFAGIVRSIRHDGTPAAPPVCVISGGETTVTLPPGHGKGGRNQEFVLATLLELGEEGCRQAAILSGGTDGEDGPTDAAGAVGDETFFAAARTKELDPAPFLEAHDAYPLFDQTGHLLRSGLTQTNVMDVRVILLTG